MPYGIASLADFVEFNTKLAKNSYAQKRGHEEGAKLIAKKAEEIDANPNQFNGAKAMFYFKNSDLEDGNILKIVPEDYASVSTALALNKDSTTIEAAAQKGQYLRPHFVAGVIVACRTADNQIIIGSRDANRNKVNPSEYPLQFPCGFIDIDEKFYDKVKTGSISELADELSQNGLRELREEVINFSDEQINRVQPISAIYETKKWPTKDGETKDVHVIKSFVVEVYVNLTYAEIAAERERQIIELTQKIAVTDPNSAEIEELKQQQKDFGEMTQMGSIASSDLAALLQGKKGNEVEINFDGKPRKFVAEHGLTIDSVAQNLEKPSGIFLHSLTATSIAPQKSVQQNTDH